MNTDAVLRMLIGVLGLMPTTFFLMQTLKWRGSITKVLILQISFNVLSCSAKEYMNLLSGQEVIGMTSWVLMAIYLSGVFLCFGDSLKRIILMVVIAIGCTTVAELICNAIFVNNGWLVTGSFWGVYDYVRAMTCEIILLSLILMGLVSLIKWRRSLFREKSQIVTALIAVSVLAGMYPYMDYISKKQHAVSIGQQFLFILIIMIYMFLPLIAQETEKRQENEKLLKALNDQFEIEKSHLKLMEDFETDQRKLEHDFNNQMMVVMGMMEMGEWMAAEDMLGEMEKRIGEV